MDEKVFQNVLIVDAEAESASRLLDALSRMEIRGTVVRDAASAAKKVESLTWDMVIIDANACRGQYQGLIERIKLQSPETPVVSATREESVAATVSAMRIGCADVLIKPFDLERVREQLEALLPSHEIPMAAAAESNSRCLYRMVGNSPSFLDTLALTRKVAPTSMSILVTGESGTGKELISYFLHRQSSRSRGPYIRVNCAALSESLLESELFGHERGAFTGAYSRRKGRFERAHGGTLLLDEISETGPRLQAELLRVLETQDFERLGGSELVQVNVRVITTTNRDLAKEMEQGRFRRDLFYRIRGLSIHVPPLRERREDIPILTWHFVNLYAREVRRRIVELDVGMLKLFGEYHWPGNVRQLRNDVRTALILGDGPVLSLDNAPMIEVELTSPAAPATGGTSLHDLERRAILETLRRTQSHQAKAARILGISDRTLREKLRKYREEGTLQPAGEQRW